VRAGRIGASHVGGASSVAQLEQNVDALDSLELSPEELTQIDEHTTTDADIDLWERARAGKW
jgi:L-glyceraldehyde 3-phosphate reductase